MLLDSLYKSPSQSEKDKKAKIIFILKIIIAIALLVVLINFFSVGEILSVLQKADWRYLVLVFLLSGVNLSLQWFKWHKFLDFGLEGITKKDSAASFLTGLTAGITTPARLGEHIGRAVALKKYKFANVVILSTVDKFYNVLVITFLGFAGTILFYKLFYSEKFYINVTTIILLTVILVVFVFVIFGKGFFPEYIKRKLKKYSFVENNLDILKRIFRGGLKKKFILLGINISYYLIILLQFSILCIMFGAEASVFSIMLIFSIVLLATTLILPISFSDLGVRESAASYLITLIGIESVIGFNASILLFVMNILIPSLVGFIFLFKK